MSGAFDVRAARVNAGFTVRSLAEKLEMHPATLQRIEDGEAAHPRNVKKVADFFEVKVTDIVSLDVPAGAA